MNSRERFLETMRFGKPDHVPYFEEGIRDGVWKNWRKQGLKRKTDLVRMFATDEREEFDLDVDPHPQPKIWPGTLEHLKIFERGMDPEDPSRLPKDWRKRVAAWKKREHVLMTRVHNGFFLTMGVEDWRRFYQVMELVKDDPRFTHEMLNIQGELSARMLERVLQEVEFDAVVFSEPIGGNNGPTISPKMYEEYVLSSYQPILDVLKRHGVENIVMRTYANARLLIPSILKYGFNCLWACEVNTEAMDYHAIRREFGRDLRLIGGIDLDVLRYGKEAIRREIEETVPPLLAQGGYVPLADGRVREDIPLENYLYYRELLEKVTQM